jgi:hypothetical protein
MESEFPEFIAANFIGTWTVHSALSEIEVLTNRHNNVILSFQGTRVELSILSSPTAARWRCIEKKTTKNAPKEWRVSPPFCGIL